MTTKFIGMKDFRQNMTKYSALAQKQNTRFIVLKKNTPIFEVNAIKDGDYDYVKLTQELDAAEEKVKNGEFYTADEIRQDLGIN